MKKIILFTKLYPYAKTEAFLESEIKVLSNYFDHITICPAYKDSYVRETPINVVVDNTYTIDKKRRFYCSLISITNGLFFKYIRDHGRNALNFNNLKNLLRYASYEIYYDHVYRKSRKTFALDESTIIYSYWFSYIVNSMVRIKLKYNLNMKIVSRTHRWDIYEDRSTIFPYRQHTMNYIDTLYSISQEGKNYIQERYGNDSKIKVARLGVFDNGCLSSSSINGQFVILSVSQITKRKRILFLYRAIVEYAKKNPSLHFKWIHFGIGDQQNALEELIKQNDRINLHIELKGYVANKDIYEFYKTEAVDVFVNLSDSEGIPVSIMEAQSFGIPIIATNVGGVSEIVNNEVGVLLTTNPTLSDICKALDTVNQKQFDRNQIKEVWNEISNAERNFRQFSEVLMNL